MKGALVAAERASLLRPSGGGKTYTTHDAVEAIRRIDLDVPAGELVAVVGPHGSGRPRCTHWIPGLKPATRGRITVPGRRIRGISPDRARLIKEAGVPPWLDARRNVELALRKRRIPAFERAAIARRSLDDPFEAVMPADCVVVLSPRPARVTAELTIGVPPPRRADDPCRRAYARDRSTGLRAVAA